MIKLIGKNQVKKLTINKKIVIQPDVKFGHF